MNFTIIGNHQSQKGNPIPYHRSTQRSLWNESSKRYVGWKNYVLWNAKRGFRITGTPRGRVSVEIFFGTENHADPDNIVKGILDAMFENDKHIDVETTHHCGDPNPRVVVTISTDA